MRGLDELTKIRIALPTPPPLNKLERDVIDILKEQRDALRKENDTLRLKLLGHDKQVAGLVRNLRAANEDADALLEVVSLFAGVVTNEKGLWRAVRERARKLLESRGVQPPSTLGSSRQRASKTKTTKTVTTESS